ncbi:uncharacterized protein G2W53_014566 [Senna tora]|uniref:Uncharacterized protein n=1 Tax=Senna tora TaxID=362788 RepID=A0A834WTR9_9FABA|nr:uncharacterized protein G2W53_014566 [Senna tora]
MGHVIASKACDVVSKHILNRKSRLNLKRIQEVQDQTCCCTSESNRSLRVVFGIPSGFEGRMGLLIAWKACEVVFKHIVN